MALAVPRRRGAVFNRSTVKPFNRFNRFNR
jgi:hypothetical protein